MIFFEAPIFLKDNETYFPQSFPDGNLQIINAGEEPLQDYPILWNLDLKLFDRLQKPLSDNEQFAEIEKQLLDFCASIEEYQENTLGVLLFSGSLKDVLNFTWDSLQNDNFKVWRNQVDPDQILSDDYLINHYACKVLNDFLEILTSGVPQRLEWFVQLDATSIYDEVEFYQLANPARFEQVHVFWRCPTQETIANLVWEIGIPLQGYHAKQKLDLAMQESITTAWCLPPSSIIDLSELHHQKEVLEKLEKAGIKHRPIPEEKIALNWQGLDTIIVISHQITPQGKRQLAGFCAAGGSVVTVGELLGLPNEETFANFMNAYVSA